jgi:DNA ligase-associated metallophosphoesterase
VIVLNHYVAELDWGGHAWQLRPDRTIYWRHAQTLIMADPHFGKGQYFRGSGIPVPTGTTQSNLNTLDAAIQATQPKRLIVLGDFFHSSGGVTSDLLDQLRVWRDRWSELEVINTRGNHDRQAGDPPEDLRIRCVASPHVDHDDTKIRFAHEPTASPKSFTLCGHLHPGVRLQGAAKSRLRTVCFLFSERTAVLPAFGAFTGMKIMHPMRSDRVFAVGPDRVIEVSTINTASSDHTISQ